MALDYGLGRESSGDASQVEAEVRRLNGSMEVLERPPFPRLLNSVAASVVDCLRAGGKVMFCGDGGSAAEAQHLAANLVTGRGHDVPPSAGLALTADSSVLTALAVEFGYEHVFARQVEALGRPGDILYCLAPSGGSVGIVNAMAAARERGVTTVAFTGEEPRVMSRADLVVAVPSTDPATVEALHFACGHVVFAIAGMILFPRR